MSTLLYCFRCKADKPTLDEREWEQLAPLLENMIEEIKEYRRRTWASLAEAKRIGHGASALDQYFRITGYRESDPDVLWHHRLSRFGPPCTTCGKPLRTPRAKMCAECGAAV